MLAINHRYRLAPIALTRKDPVAQFKVNFRPAETVFDGIVDCGLHAVFLVHAVQERRIDVQAVFFKSLLGNVAAGQNLNNRQIKYFGKIIISLIMRRNRHDCAGTVAGQNIIRNKNGNLFAVKRVNGFYSLKLNAGFAVFLRTLQIGLLGGCFDISPNFVGILEFIHVFPHKLMLRRQNHISYAESGIWPRRKHSQFVIAEFKVKLGAFRTTDPVNLLRLDAVDKIQIVQIVNQAVGVFGNRDHPLFFILAYDLRAAAFATAVDNFFVGQADFAGRTPVDGYFVFVGQTFFEEFDKHPLRPFVIFRIAGADTSVPIETKAERFQLLGKRRNIGRRRNCRMHAGFNGVVLGRQTKSVKTHRIKYVEPLHSFLAGNHVKSGIRARMSDMQPGTRRIRELDQSVELLFVPVYFDTIGFFFIPNCLPLFFNSLEIIAVFQFPAFLPLLKSLFSVKSFTHQFRPCG